MSEYSSLDKRDVPMPRTDVAAEMELESVAEAIDGAGFNVGAVRVRQAIREIERLQRELAEAQRWKDAVFDALVVNCILSSGHEHDPRRAVADLIAWEQIIALDPAVSSAAHDLRESGFEAGVEAAKAEAVRDRNAILQAVARGWCSTKNAHKEMDADLATVIADEVYSALKESEAPQEKAEAQPLHPGAVPADASPTAELPSSEKDRHAVVPHPLGDEVLMPRKLTAENGMKGALIGEFWFKPHEDAGPVYVPWVTIKEIYDRVVSLVGRSVVPSATQPNPAPPEYRHTYAARTGWTPEQWDKVWREHAEEHERLAHHARSEIGRLNGVDSEGKGSSSGAYWRSAADLVRTLKESEAPQALQETAKGVSNGGTTQMDSTSASGAPLPPEQRDGRIHQTPAVASPRRFQGGLSNDELRAAWGAKVPSVQPTEAELTAFALGIEVGDSLPAELPSAIPRRNEP